MKAVVLRESGGPEKLELAEVPDLEPGEGEVLVRAHAAGINFLDVLVRLGRYPRRRRCRRSRAPRSRATWTGGA